MGVQSVQLPRQIVKIHDVKAATMVGDARDGVGYIELRGFSEDAGREMRAAINALQRRAEYASNGEHGLKVSLRFQLLLTDESHIKLKKL